jgi:hypothetical protein
MVEYLFISSVTNGIWRSLCNVKFETYHGALVMVRSTFDWNQMHSHVPCSGVEYSSVFCLTNLFLCNDCTREELIAALPCKGQDFIHYLPLSTNQLLCCLGLYPPQNQPLYLSQEISSGAFRVVLRSNNLGVLIICVLYHTRALFILNSLFREL